MGKKSRSTKKKSSASNSGGKRKAKATGAAAAANPFATSETNAQKNDTNLPFQSIYHVYKAATTRFKEQLANLIPANTFNLDFVKSFLDAADYIKDNDIPIDDSILRNLRLAISVRKKYSQNLEDGGDEGHSYFLLVLNYCLQILRQCKVVSQAKHSNSKKDDDDDINNNSDDICNRFDALSMLEDDEDGDSEEEDGDITSDRPEPPSKEYSYDDLMHFPDRAKCLLFFDTMAFYAHDYSRLLKNLKETMRMEAEGEYPTECVPIELMCQGICANLMIRNIQELENELYVECPALKDSPYRVLVCSFMSPFVNMISASVQTSSPRANQWNDDFAFAFLADVVEAVFRCKQKQIVGIADRFSQRWKMANGDKIVWLAVVTARMVMKNAGTKAESGPSPWKLDESSDHVLEEFPKWLREDHEDKLWESINGDNSILNTMKLLDGFGSNLCPFEKDDSDEFVTILAKIWNGNVWTDSNPASSIRGDLDATLLSLLMHFTQSKWRVDGGDFPMQKQMLPLVHLFRKGGDFRPKPSFALIFALHAMMMSIFELQGDGDIFRIRDLSKMSFDRFMLQAGEHLKSDIPCSSKRETCLKVITSTKEVIKKSDDADFAKTYPMTSEELHDLLIWNPMSAGMLLAYTNIYLSLDGGFHAMSLNEEIRVVLHLFNALKSHELVDYELPLLSDIDRYFDKSKCIWNGWEKPLQGKFVYRLHLSMGATNEMAMYAQDKAAGEKPLNKPFVSQAKIDRTRKTSKRVSTEIDPAEVSLAFRRYCRHDFKVTEDDLKATNKLLAGGTQQQGVDLNNSLKIDPRNPLPVPWQIHDVHIRLLARSIMADFESGLLKYNMVAVGTVFSQFLHDTFHPDNNEHIAEYEAKLKELGRADHKGDLRSLVAIGIVDKILAILDFDPEPEKLLYLGEAFEEFFYNLDLERVHSFEGV